MKCKPTLKNQTKVQSKKINLESQQQTWKPNYKFYKLSKIATKSNSLGYLGWKRSRLLLGFLIWLVFVVEEDDGHHNRQGLRWCWKSIVSVVVTTICVAPIKEVKRSGNRRGRAQRERETENWTEDFDLPYIFFRGIKMLFQNNVFIKTLF